MFAAMTFREIYSAYISGLVPVYGTGEAQAITNLVFEGLAGISRSDMTVHAEKIAGEKMLDLLLSSLEKIKNHIPVQHVIGFAWFYGMRFRVNEHVLIPRSETEELVLEAINYLKISPEKKILDIGTGSGCIPISIKKHIPAAQITSVDINEDALQVAAENATANNVQVHFRKLDFLHEENWSLLSTYDIIISNPPYIPQDEEKEMDPHVTMYEPALALFVPQNDPLLFYKKIRQFADGHLKKDGKIFLEIHRSFGKKTAAIFQEEKYTAELKKDMSGNDRMVIVNRCP
jgi:release factor glutamine methyltransferase